MGNRSRGKYALIKLRPRDVSIMAGETADVEGGKGAVYSLVLKDAIDFGNKADTDFFVIRLKDKYAEPALRAYSEAAMADDPEYANEVLRLADMAKNHPFQRKPD